ncbi:MAG: RNA pseudouridine synthase [Gammaproteobacteria bacterium HGW-Gammaproteobacteria-8]|nr:MAG: RNA pseudouridine synthase [Gammaproteobacteria bacterium HGW-Gammaproteobacteria-8]
MSKTELIQRRFEATSAQSGQRVDQAAAAVWPEFSRSRLSDWIRAGELRVDGHAVKPNFRLLEGSRVALDTAFGPRPDTPEPESIPLRVLVDDPALLIIDKPAGLVVHPGSGNSAGTLVNALLYLDPGLAALPRAGLVHRLDKDTSGCLLVARTLQAHTVLVQQLKRREIERHYLAVVWGPMVAGGSVGAPLGRHPVDRRRQVVRADGRRAVTHYRVRQRLNGATALDVKLETGRTHQIRVHMQHIGHPLIGDPVYGRKGSPRGLDEAQREVWRTFPRQALHAWRLQLSHPLSGQPVSAEAAIPADLGALIRSLALD